jgi:gluconolactonase
MLCSAIGGTAMKCAWFMLRLASLQLGSALVAAPVDPPVERLDASFDVLVAPTARLETLVRRDTIFEGPTWVSKRGSSYLLFSDVPGGVIDRWDANGQVSVFLRNIFRGTRAAYRSTGQTSYSMQGANGTTLDRQGRLVYCEFSDGEIVRLERDGRRTIIASRFAGKRLNAPNDLVYGPDGSLYFTDSRRGASAKDVPDKGLYVLRAGEVQLLSKDIDHPNGVAFSPDGNFLYVTDTLKKAILRFEIKRAQIRNEQTFVDMSADKRAGAPDGVKVDKNGDVFATGPGGLWIISPTGKHIGTILTPTPLTNLAFGGEDLRTLYLTGVGALYRIRLQPLRSHTNKVLLNQPTARRSGSLAR